MNLTAKMVTEDLSGGWKVDTMNFITNDICIVKANDNIADREEVYIIFILKNNSWRRQTHIYTDLEEAILNAFGFKYGNENSQFGKFAINMLGKK